MRTVLITGARGFIGRNLVAHLRCRQDVRVFGYDLDNTEVELRDWAGQADVVFHLAGVNRPQRPEEFETGNVGFTRRLCEVLASRGSKVHLIVSSSIQAELDNPYGRSKRRAEEVLREFAGRTGSRVSIFRLKNVFGKWCRPNYNSVVATFCHHIANDLPIQIDDPSRWVELVHIDDVVAAFLQEMDTAPSREDVLVSPDGIPSYRVTLGDLAGRIQFFRDMQHSLQVPDFSIRFHQQLYGTYLSYVEPSRWEFGLAVKQDERGRLAEFMKSAWGGQIFVLRTVPGVMRGNHYHHVKAERFLVLTGEALIRLRHIEGTEILEHRVCGGEDRVVEIPPGYTHSLTNTGTSESITLVWASEIFDPDRPDTYFLPVDLPSTRSDAASRHS